MTSQSHMLLHILRMFGHSSRGGTGALMVVQQKIVYNNSKHNALKETNIEKIIFSPIFFSLGYCRLVEPLSN